MKFESLIANINSSNAALHDCSVVSLGFRIYFLLMSQVQFYLPTPLSRNIKFPNGRSKAWSLRGGPTVKFHYSLPLEIIPDLGLVITSYMWNGGIARIRGIGRDKIFRIPSIRKKILTWSINFPFWANKIIKIVSKSNSVYTKIKTLNANHLKFNSCAFFIGHFPEQLQALW